jgi:heme/copper-type cytochrome/quinol oxidase subunit 1
VTFPAAVLLVAGSLHVWLPLIGAAGGWTMYMPLAVRRGGVQFLGNEQSWHLQAFLLGRWTLPIAAR